MNNKFILLYLIIPPSVAFAEGVDLSYSLFSGSSYYIVKAVPQRLESKLIFPYRLRTIGISTKKTYGNIPIKFGINFPIHKESLTGKDYDWYEDQLTVLSSSNNSLNSFYDISIAWEPESTAKLSYEVDISYRRMSFDWYDTSQYDYVKYKEFFGAGKSLQFQQDVVLVSVGVNYLLWNKRNIYLNVGGAIRAGVGWLKDVHILRDFYTLQTTWLLGYSAGVDVSYHLGEDSRLTLRYSINDMNGIESNMKYYFRYSGSEYASYPSKFKNLERKITILYSISF